MKSKVLVTGGNGHVGYNIVKELVSRGYDVRVSVRNKNDLAKVARLRKLDVEIVEADLLNIESLDAATAGIDGVFQVAAGYKLHSKDPENEIRRPALDGTKNVLLACKKNGVKKIIYTSSIATIGVSRNKQRLNENNWNEDAHEYYAKAKSDAERLAWQIAEQERLNMVSILPGAVIGPDFEMHTPTTFIFQKILKNQIPMNVDVSLAFIDVRDLAKAHVDAYESATAQGRYIVCGDLIPMEAVFKAANRKYSSVKIPTKQVPAFLIPMLPFFDWVESKLTGSMRTFTRGVLEEYMTGGKQLLDNTKAKKDLNLKPRSITETLEDTFDWIHDHDIKWS